MWYSVSCFGGIVSVMFHFMFVHFFYFFIYFFNNSIEFSNEIRDLMIMTRCFRSGVGCDVRGYILYVCVHYTFSSVWVAEWPPFGK